MMHIPDGRLVIVGAQRMQVRSSRSRVRITLQELFLIWLGGRITSPRVWFGAGGQGVTLKLAWGPSNSSPWICILFLLSFQFFLFLSSFYALFFFPFFSEQFYFRERNLVRVGCIFPFFFFRNQVQHLSLCLSHYYYYHLFIFLIIWFLHFGWGQLQTSVF